MVKYLILFLLTPIIILSAFIDTLWVWDSDDPDGFAETLLICKNQKVVKVWRFGDWAVFLCERMDDGEKENGGGLPRARGKWMTTLSF